MGNLHHDPGRRRRRSSAATPSTTDSFGGAPSPSPRPSPAASAARGRPPQEQAYGARVHRGHDQCTTIGTSGGSGAPRRRSFPVFSDDDHFEESSPSSSRYDYPHHPATAAAAAAAAAVAAAATVAYLPRRDLETAVNDRGNDPPLPQPREQREDGGEPSERRRYRRSASEAAAGGGRPDDRAQGGPVDNRYTNHDRRQVPLAGGRGEEQVLEQLSRENLRPREEKEEEGARDFFAVRRRGTRPGTVPPQSPDVRRRHGSDHHGGNQQQQQQQQERWQHRGRSKPHLDPERGTARAAGGGPSAESGTSVGRPLPPPQSQPQPRAPEFVVHAEAVFRWAGVEGLTPEVLRRAKRGLRDEEVVSWRSG